MIFWDLCLHAERAGLEPRRTAGSGAPAMYIYHHHRDPTPAGTQRTGAIIYRSQVSHPFENSSDSPSAPPANVTSASCKFPGCALVVALQPAVACEPDPCLGQILTC